MSIAPLEMIPEGLRPVLSALCAVGRDVAKVIAKGPLEQSLAEAVGENAGGDGQKALDVIAEAIRRTPAKAYVDNYVKILASTGRGPDGRKLKDAKPVVRAKSPSTRNLRNVPATRSVNRFRSSGRTATTPSRWSG